MVTFVTSLSRLKKDHRFYYAQVAPKDYRKAHNQIDILIQFTTSLKMSFLYQTTPVLRTAVRSSIVRSSPRLFSTTVIQQKSATESVKDGLKTVDRAVSDVAVAGIDKGVELKDKAAEAIGVETQKAEGTASQVAGEAKGKAAEVTGKAKGKAEEVKGKMS
ncbi:uncharacterized protein PV07_08371 [Cladophialophora immunda]|uniref:Uncharacterized protein n=1 Tax=Cladophialophora immunda TaxID=569365 RepID=A0A0D2CCB2_9EURO|nr:uncharacterized protein PV07_08371 [Cladophialophora immunda]KIW28733.1 hypothetical protein PV07_08371 [Cladophialophora immunda]